jgi:lysophospholipase L1-like esterase
MTTKHFLACLALITFVSVVSQAQPPAAVKNAPGVSSSSPTAAHDFDKWEKEVAVYEAADRANPPPKGAVLFIGSSTIRLWKTLADDFPDHKVINRGIGGSEIVDSTHFAGRIIFPYEPRQIFLRAGGNDIHSGRLPEEVAADFAEFVQKVHARLPRTEIYYIFVSPAPARWGENDKYRDLNRRIREMALRMPRVACVDAYDVSLSSEGQARHELFVADKLHFNAEGYKLLAERVRPYMPTPPPK